MLIYTDLLILMFLITSTHSYVCDQIYSFLCLWSHLLILMFEITSTHSYVCDHIYSFLCLRSHLKQYLLHFIFLYFFFVSKKIYSGFPRCRERHFSTSHLLHDSSSLHKIYSFLCFWSHLLILMFLIRSTHSYACDHIYSFLCLWSHLLILMFLIRSTHSYVCDQIYSFLCLWSHLLIVDVITNFRMSRSDHKYKNE
jgi:hypothetical protein